MLHTYIHVCTLYTITSQICFMGITLVRGSFHCYKIIISTHRYSFFFSCSAQMAEPYKDTLTPQWVHYGDS